MRTTVEVLPAPDAWAARIGGRLVAAARAAVQRSGQFLLVLPGGATPLPLFRWLSGPGRTEVPWSLTHLLWGDERCVAIDDPRSNFGAAHTEFVSRVPIPPGQVHRWRGELPPEKAMAEFEATLHALIEWTHRTPPPTPVFDLTILGVGPDGHTASLFPGRPTLRVADRWVAEEPDPPRDPKVPRLTLTLPALSSSRDVFVLATGPEKREVVRRLLLPSAEPPLPAGLVRATDERVFFLDPSAAGGLSGVDGASSTAPGVA